MNIYNYAVNNNTNDILTQLENATHQCTNTTIGDVSYAMYCTSLEDATQSSCLNLPTNYTQHGINCTNDGIQSLADQFGKATDQNCFISCTNLSPSSLSNTVTPDFILMFVAFLFLMLGRKE